MGAVGQGMSVVARRRVVTWLTSAALVAASLVGLAASPAEAAAVAVTPR
jgi:hypothetical protein